MLQMIAENDDHLPIDSRANGGSVLECDRLVAAFQNADESAHSKHERTEDATCGVGYQSEAWGVPQRKITRTATRHGMKVPIVKARSQAEERRPPFALP